MATTVYLFDATIPAGTAASSPATVDMSMPPVIVDRIQIIVPPGPSGLVGFQLTSGGMPVIPVTPGSWIITDDEVIDWDLTGQIDSGGWELTGYNTGTLDHTITVRFLVDPAVTPPVAPATLIPADQLAPAATVGAGG